MTQRDQPDDGLLGLDFKLVDGTVTLDDVARKFEVECGNRAACIHDHAFGKTAHAKEVGRQMLKLIGKGCNNMIGHFSYLPGA